MIRTIEPTEAKQILEKHRFSGQRRESQYHINYLVNEMNEDRFQDGTQIAFAVNGNKKWLIDGYQRLEAIILSNKPAMFEVTLLPVDSKDEIPDMYSRFDQGRARTFSDTVGAFNLIERTGMTATALNQLASSVRFVRAGFSHQPKRVPLEIVKDLVMEWYPEGATYWNAIIGENTRISLPFRNYGMMATGLVTLRHEPDVALRFWKGTVEDDGLRKGDPRKALLRFLTKYRVGRTSSLRVQQMNTLLHTKYVARAWNHFYTGSDVAWLVIKDENAVIPIEGTPYEVGTSRAKESN